MIFQLDRNAPEWARRHWTARLPSRNAEAMASGTSASANTTPARLRATWAFISCSRAAANALRSSAFARATRRVGLGLIGLQSGADVLAHVDVGNVDRHDLKRRLGIQAAFEHRLRDAVGMLHHLQVAVGRADGRDDAFAHPRDDRLLGGPADQLLDVRANRHPSANLQLHAVFGDGAQGGPLRPLGVGAVDHLRIDARLHGVEHVAAGQIDGRRAVEIQVDVGAVGGDDRLDDVRHAAAGQIMRFEPLRADAGLFFPADARLHGHDLAEHDHFGVDAAEAHADQAQQTNVGARHVRAEPDCGVFDQNDRDDDGDQQQGQHAHQPRQRNLSQQNRDSVKHGVSPFFVVQASRLPCFVVRTAGPTRISHHSGKMTNGVSLVLTVWRAMRANPSNYFDAMPNPPQPPHAGYCQTQTKFLRLPRTSTMVLDAKDWRRNNCRTTQGDSPIFVGRKLGQSPLRRTP